MVFKLKILIKRFRSFLCIVINTFLELKYLWLDKHLLHIIIEKQLKKHKGIFKHIFFFDYMKININQRNSILFSSEKILSKEFTFLGTSKWPQYTTWNYDPLSKTYWEKQYYKFINPINGCSDIKIPWELSRFQHLPTLAIAYKITQIKTFLEDINNEINDWIDENPYLYGVNWLNAMEVALRAINLILTIDLLGGFHVLAPDVSNKLIRVLFKHGVYINNHIEIYKNNITTNHTISDYFGLFIIGCLFEKTRISSKWTKKGWHGLEEEITKQITEEGVDYEMSIQYHRFTTELFLYGYIIALSNNITPTEVYTEHLIKMLHFIDCYTRPDGMSPQFGDNDDGRVLILSNYINWNVRDHRYLLTMGHKLFPLEKFKNIPNDVPIEIYLIKDKLIDLVKNIAIEKTKNYLDSGFAFLNSDRIWLMVSAHKCGTNGMGNHTHNDLGSFELCVDSSPFFIDIGSYTYSSKPEERFNFRKTDAHNTIVVDEVEQNELAIENLFNFPKEYYDSKFLAKKFQNNIYTIKVSINGYKRLNTPVYIERTFILYKKTDQLTIIDNIFSNDTHEINWFFHLDNGVVIEDIKGEYEIHIINGLSKIRFTVNCDPCDSYSIENNWISYSYNKKIHAPVIRFSSKGKNIIKIWKIQTL